MYSVFENHLDGGFFIDNNYEPKFCSQCGDIDRFIGCFDNYEQLFEYLTDLDVFLGYDEKYLKDMFENAEEE